MLLSFETHHIDAACEIFLPGLIRLAKIFLPQVTFGQQRVEEEQRELQGM